MANRYSRHGRKLIEPPTEDLPWKAIQFHDLCSQCPAGFARYKVPTSAVNAFAVVIVAKRQELTFEINGIPGQYLAEKFPPDPFLGAAHFDFRDPASLARADRWREPASHRMSVVSRVAATARTSLASAKVSLPA